MSHHERNSFRRTLVPATQTRRPCEAHHRSCRSIHACPHRPNSAWKYSGTSPSCRHKIRARENASRVSAGGIPLNRNQRYSQRQLNIDLLFDPIGRFRQGVQKLKGLSETRNRFNIGGMRERALPGVEPATDGPLMIARFLIVIGQDFGLTFGELRIIPVPGSLRCPRGSAASCS